MRSLTYPEKNKKQIFATDAKIKAAVVRGGDNLSPRIDQSYIRAADWKSWSRSPETKRGTSSNVAVVRHRKICILKLWTRFSVSDWASVDVLTLAGLHQQHF